MNTKEEIAMQSQKHEEVKRALVAEQANKTQNVPARPSDSRDKSSKNCSTVIAR